MKIFNYIIRDSIKNFKYLGKWNKNVENITRENYKTLLKEIREDLSK